MAETQVAEKDRGGTARQPERSLIPAWVLEIERIVAEETALCRRRLQSQATEGREE